MELEHIPPYPQTPISRARCFAAALALAAALPSAAFADSLSTAPGPGLPSGHGAGIDACVEQGLMRIGAPGAAVALVVDGELVFQKGYGVKRYGLPDPVGHRTLFKAGSVQKMMTAAAVMIQEQEGRLSLGDRVIQHVPELELGGPWPTRRIRVEDLLTHRSGVPDFSDLTCNDDLSTWAAGLGSTPLFAPAGAFYNYTNAGYSLAGLVAERAAGRSYADVMRDDVWGPAGMGSTVLTPAEALAYGDVSFGHGLDAQGQLEILAPDAYECPWAAPSGDFFTTAPDLARFALTLMDDGGDMLDADAADRMQAPVVATWDDPDERYGYGIGVREVEGSRYHYHGGAVPGWSSHMLWSKGQGFAFAVAANAVADLSAISHCALDTVLDVDWPEPVTTSPPSSWNRFSGAYLIRTFEGGPLLPTLVLRVGDTLWTLFPDPIDRGVLTLPAVPLGPRNFWIDIDGDGEPSGLEWITFVESEGRWGIRRTWLRNRLYVGAKLFGVYGFGPRRGDLPEVTGDGSAAEARIDGAQINEAQIGGEHAETWRALMRAAEALQD